MTTTERVRGDSLAALLAQDLRERWGEITAEAAGRGDLEAERAELHLAAAMSIAMEMFFEKGDPADPHFTEWEHPWRKFGGDNPGTVYLSAPVDPRLSYRIRGRAASARYVGVQMYTRGPGFNAASANLSDHELRMTPAGDLDITVAAADPGDGRPWLPLIEGDYLVMIRVYRQDVFGPDPDLTIEVVDGELPSTSVRERSAAAVAFFNEGVRSTMSVTDVLRSAGANLYPPADAPVRRPKYMGALFPTRDNVYDGCWMELADGQMLDVRGRLPDARYSSFVFYDRWFATLDYRRTRCFLTADEIQLAEDGSYRVLIGPTDPGEPNWIDTGGLTQGIFAIRTLLPQSRELPSLTVVGAG